LKITVVDRQLNDSSYAASPFSTKADSSCYRSTVENGEAALVFSILFFIMANAWKNVVDLFDRPPSNDKQEAMGRICIYGKQSSI